MATKKKPKPTSNIIAQNRRARFEYTLHEHYEAGIALTGWEVKSLREGKAQLTEAYVLLQNNEAYLMGANFTPLNTVSTHYVAEPARNRKLLLNRKELNQLVSAVQQKGQTCVPLSLYWKGNHIKCEIAVASGKKTHDKRASIKDRDWRRDKQRVMKQYNR